MVHLALACTSECSYTPRTTYIHTHTSEYTLTTSNVHSSQFMPLMQFILCNTITQLVPNIFDFLIPVLEDLSVYGFLHAPRDTAHVISYRRLRNLCNVKAYSEPYKGSHVHQSHVAKIPQSPVTSPIPRVLIGGRDPPLCFICCKDSTIFRPSHGAAVWAFTCTARRIV